MASNRNGRIGCAAEPAAAMPVCVRCAWTVSSTDSVLLYVSNQISGGLGTVTASPGSMGSVTIAFAFRHAVIHTLLLPPGSEISFRMTGFDHIHMTPLSNAMASGELLLQVFTDGF